MAYRTIRFNEWLELHQNWPKLDLFCCKLLLNAHQESEVTLLGMHKVLAMDSTALDALERLYEKIHRRGKHLILSGPQSQPLFLMEKAGFVDQIGPENLVGHMNDALARARELLR